MEYACPNGTGGDDMGTRNRLPDDSGGDFHRFFTYCHCEGGTTAAISLETILKYFIEKIH